MPSGMPLKTSNALPYCVSTILLPSTSAPALKEMPVGGALSPTAKSFPSEVLPMHTSHPAKQVTWKSPGPRSLEFKPVFTQVKEGKIDCVVYRRAVPRARAREVKAAAAAVEAATATATARPVAPYTVAGARGTLPCWGALSRRAAIEAIAAPLDVRGNSEKVKHSSTEAHTIATAPTAKAARRIDRLRAMAK